MDTIAETKEGAERKAAMYILHDEETKKMAELQKKRQEIQNERLQSTFRHRLEQVYPLSSNIE